MDRLRGRKDTPTAPLVGTSPGVTQAPISISDRTVSTLLGDTAQNTFIHTKCSALQINKNGHIIAISSRKDEFMP
eukprot:COSAG01_NODE_27157_length_692_cov_23.834739_1_plen_74_part_10